MKFYDRKKEIEILRRNWEKSAKHSLFYCDDRQKTYRKDASLAQDGARVEDCFLRFWFRFVLPNQALIETERNDLLLEIVERDYNDYTGLVLEQFFRQKIAVMPTDIILNSCRRNLNRFVVISESIKKCS